MITVASESVSELQLSVRHRAWIALYSIANSPVNRAEIMRVNNVTETDLAEFEESWRRMRKRVPPG